ncbi:MAG: amino acid permease [Candidatus Eremiobacteraeota bacterium]|nr:amino acid permease [Candidatus Eremiobacteraeota bacterium]
MAQPAVPALLRRLTVFDLALVTVGSIVGSGIFRSPSVVAVRAHTPFLILLAWVLGGVVALIGAWIFAELAARRPSDGGFYAYLRDAFHPVFAFLYGWMMLFIFDTGAMAAAAITFANYFEPLTGLAVPAALLATVAIGFFTAINCLGVRQGSTTQNVLVILKLGALAFLIVVGFVAKPVPAATAPVAAFSSGGSALAALGIAMIPVFFAYNGFVVPTYLTGETKNPTTTIPRGLVIGIGLVIAAYLLTNAACLRVLGAQGLMLTKTPASDVLRAAFGTLGGRLIAATVALSTLGYISTKLLAAPRVYHRMAADGLFFKQAAWVHPKTHVPVVAIALEGLVAALIALSGTFETIINYVVSFEFSFIGMAAIALFVFRRRDAGTSADAVVPFKTPGHPYTTVLFLIALSGVVLDTFVTYPINALIGGAVLAGGAIVYYFWKRSPIRQAPGEA